MLYRSGSRVLSTDIIKTLSSCGIVITTYHEVMSQYPKCDPPKHIVQDINLNEWWANYYESNKGPLLKITWHRIILDESHLIKNPEGRTSNACRHLSGKYRWLVTGTPIQNGIEELFAYFHFLGVQGAGKYEDFKKNYAKRSAQCNERLDAVLRSIMIRRTGSDELFGRPILSLPELDHQTIILEFNPTERAIYQIVRARFIARINEWSMGGSAIKNHRNMFVMLLRLRQMCAHPLLIANTMKDLLEAEDLEKL